MKGIKAEKPAERKRRSLRRRKRIKHSLRDRDWEDQPGPMLRGRNIRYEIAERDRGTASGGMGLIHRTVQELRLPERINEKLHLLKVHLPDWESGHVLHIAYNALMDGTCLEDIELRRERSASLHKGPLPARRAGSAPAARARRAGAGHGGVARRGGSAHA